MELKRKTAVIIGAGPAGLTAALELLRTSDIKPIVLEKSDMVGGISRTVRFGENRMDIGGHRFFSKSDKVVDWWLDIMPLEEKEGDAVEISYQNNKKEIYHKSDGKKGGDMLVRSRKSRIHYNGKFFDYPIALSIETFRNLGFMKMVRIAASYTKAIVIPRKENNLEDFFINRFGGELYRTFFKTYTEKVWGKSCTEMSPEWGRQRVKGLSVWKAVMEPFKKTFRPIVRKLDIRQKDTETSLIEYFMYPRLGPGQMWEVVSEKIIELGGEIHFGASVDGMTHDVTNKKISKVAFTDAATKESQDIEAEYFFTTMPVKDLFKALSPNDPSLEYETAANLQYRDFLTVGLLISHLKEPIDDNWIYVHDPNVKVGRIQFFHNWSPDMVKTEGTHLLGLEYFCNEGSELWQMSDKEIAAFATKELVELGFIDANESVRDYKVERVEKAYPVYAGSYDQFPRIRSYIDTISNLYPIGRNGMHRYNNQDHSMLTAMKSVECLLSGGDKSSIWDVNAEQEYHEEK